MSALVRLILNCSMKKLQFLGGYLPQWPACDLILDLQRKMGNYHTAIFGLLWLMSFFSA